MYFITIVRSYDNNEYHKLRYDDVKGTTSKV